MACQFFQLPGEVRNIIYHEYSRSCSVTIRPGQTISDHLESENGENVEIQATAPQKCMAMTILAISKDFRRGAQWSFYTETSFTIKRRFSRNTRRGGCGIDQRIRNLTVEQEPYVGLWSGTISFLNRHFDGRDVSIKELTILSDGFEVDDSKFRSSQHDVTINQDYSDEELKAFLRITSQRVDMLSFQMIIGGEILHLHPGFGVIRFSKPERPCQVLVRRNSGIQITTPREDDFKEIRSRLMEVQKQSVRQVDFHWLK